MEEKTFFKFPEQSCKVKFAAKNKIKKLEYYAANKQINLSQLTALREVSITKDTSVKVSKKWYKKTKKKLKVYILTRLGKQNHQATGKGYPAQLP